LPSSSCSRLSWGLTCRASCTTAYSVCWAGKEPIRQNGNHDNCYKNRTWRSACRSSMDVPSFIALVSVNHDVLAKADQLSSCASGHLTVRNPIIQKVTSRDHRRCRLNCGRRRQQLPNLSSNAVNIITTKSRTPIIPRTSIFFLRKAHSWSVPIHLSIHDDHTYRYVQQL
jgi:hypothetical protein